MSGVRPERRTVAPLVLCLVLEPPSAAQSLLLSLGTGECHFGQAETLTVFDNLIVNDVITWQRREAQETEVRDVRTDSGSRCQVQ